MRFQSQILLVVALIGVATNMIGATPLPYHNTCDNISTVTVLNESNSSSSKWQTYKYSDNSVFRCKQSSSDAVRNVHATVWTSALEIETGKLYRASVVVGSQGKADAVSAAELAMYASANASAEKNTILRVAPLPIFSTTSRPAAVEAIFVGDATKPYLGIKDSSGGAISYFAIDDIIIEEYNGITPLKEAEEFTAVPSSKNVTISFKLPSQDLLDNNLDNISNVTLLRGNCIIKEWSDQQPGSVLTYTDNVSTAGLYSYTVVCKIDEKTSTAKTSVEISANAEPSRSPNYEKDEEGNFYGKNYYAPATYVPGQGISISWRAHTDPNVTYSVVRMNDNKEIATNITSTQVLDTDFSLDEHAIYQYNIKYNDGTGEQVLYVTSAVSLNNSTPFIPSINIGALNEFTIIDDDKDYNVWNVVTTGSEVKHGVSTYFSTTRRGDDWLITPGLVLESGKTYRIDVDALCADLIPSNVQFEIKAGKSNSIEYMTDEVMPAIIFNHMFPETYTAFYTPSESGNVFFGIRSLDPTGENSFDDMGISSISIAEISGATPAAINDLHIVYGTTPGKASLIFTAPSKNVEGTALTSLDKIEVYQDNELISTLANPSPGQQYNIDVTFATETAVSFKVVPTSSDITGQATAISAKLLEAPYSTKFDTEEEIAEYTIINPDLTGNTWSYLPLRQAMRSFAFTRDTHNEYFITPAIHLEKGHFYKIDFLTWLEGADENHMNDNAIEVLLGTAPTIEALTTTIVQPYVVQGTLGNEVLLKDWFTVPESGAYYIAWHAISKPQLAKELFIDNINISARIPDTYPAHVENFAILPDPTGALEATISFDLPTCDMAGNAMSSDFYEYKIYCDGLEISNGPGERGKHIEYVHNTTRGIHLYTVRCFGAANEPTRDVEDVAYVGINRPGAVEFVEVTENPNNYGEVTITWGLPVSDINGFPLNTSDITYIVGEYYYDSYSGKHYETEYATGLKELSYTKVVKKNTDNQEFMRFFVRAQTSAGEGNPTVITKFTAIGKPFDLPFTESFKSGYPQHTMMQERPFEGRNASWGFNVNNPITGVEPIDNDEGLALMETIEPDNGARLFTLRISLNANRPIMTFYVYNQSNEQRTDNNILGISVREGDGEFQTVDSKSINEWAQGNPGWHKASVDLSEYAGRVVYIGFDGMAKNLTFIHVDNIMIAAPADIDLAVNTINHTDVYIGTEHEIEINVSNNGDKDITNATVNLYLDSQVIDQYSIDKLDAGQDMTITFSNKLTRNDIGKHTYRAEVSIADDADLLNNSISSASFYLQDNDYPQVEYLQAFRNNVEEIKLQWEQPLIPTQAQQITDDFEGYPAWTTMETGGLGNYTLIDADGCGVGGFQDIELPNIPYGSKQSFTLWDFSNEYFAYDQTISDRYKAHSGDKCLISIFTIGEESWVDDRLISPMLSGEAQTISFYAKSLDDSTPEYFQVRYSLDDKTSNSFGYQSVGGTWTQFTYDLPEGTKYFVIEHIGGTFFFFLDDLTYTPVGDETLVNNGYNVYRNDILLNETPIFDLSWNDIDTDNVEIKYGVSAVYDRGESPVNEIIVSPANVDDVHASISVVANDREIVITGAQGLDFAVINTSGMVLTSRRASELERIPVNPGIYMVNVAGEVYKLVIK